MRTKMFFTVLAAFAVLTVLMAGFTGQARAEDIILEGEVGGGAGFPAGIALTAEPSVVGPFGGSTITAVVTDPSGLPASGIKVEFQATAGTFAVNPVFTDDNGRAVVFFCAPDYPGDIVITATAIAEGFDPVTASTTISVSSDIPVGLRVYPKESTAEGQYGVETIFTSPRKQHEIVAKAIFTDRPPQDVTLAAEWSVSAPGVVELIAPGKIEAIGAGDVEVYATYLGVRQKVNVCSRYFHKIQQVTIDPEPVQPGGWAFITATVKDASYRYPVAGIPVNFFVPVGKVVPTSAVTDENGKARVVFLAPDTETDWEFTKGYAQIPFFCPLQSASETFYFSISVKNYGQPSPSGINGEPFHIIMSTGTTEVWAESSDATLPAQAVITARVEDVYGAPVPNMGLTFSVQKGSISPYPGFSPASTCSCVTSAEGESTIAFYPQFQAEGTLLPERNETVYVSARINGTDISATLGITVRYPDPDYGWADGFWEIHYQTYDEAAKQLREHAFWIGQTGEWTVGYPTMRWPTLIGVNGQSVTATPVEEEGVYVVQPGEYVFLNRETGEVLGNTIHIPVIEELGTFESPAGYAVSARITAPIGEPQFWKVHMTSSGDPALDDYDVIPVLANPKMEYVDPPETWQRPVKPGDVFVAKVRALYYPGPGREGTPIPAPGVMVRWWLEDPSVGTLAFDTTVTDAEGTTSNTFTLTASGKVRIRCEMIFKEDWRKLFDGTYGIIINPPGLLWGFDIAQPNTPTTTGGGSTPVVEEQPKPELTGTVYGFVKTADGAPIQGARIELHSEPRVTYTDAEGYYEFRDVPLGNHTVLIKDPSWRAKDVELARIDMVLYEKDGQVVMENAASGSVALDESSREVRVDFLAVPKEHSSSSGSQTVNTGPEAEQPAPEPEPGLEAEPVAPAVPEILAPVKLIRKIYPVPVKPTEQVPSTLTKPVERVVQTPSKPVKPVSEKKSRWPWLVLLLLPALLLRRRAVNVGLEVEGDTLYVARYAGGPSGAVKVVVTVVAEGDKVETEHSLRAGDKVAVPAPCDWQTASVTVSGRRNRAVRTSVIRR